MPLRDHFRGWLHHEVGWHSFYSAWAMMIVASLNARLPEGFRASPNVQKAIEIDVAAYGNVRAGAPDAVQPDEWQPSAATMTVPFELAERAAEVLVYGSRDG